MKKIICIVITCLLLMFCSASSYMIKAPAMEDLPHEQVLSAEAVIPEPLEESSTRDELQNKEELPSSDVSENGTHEDSDSESDEPSEIPEESHESATEGEMTEVTDSDETIPEEDTESPSADTESKDGEVSENETVPSEEKEVPQLPELVRNPEIDPEKPMIVLSFDDGPSAYTERLLDILEANGAKATFFLVGKGIDYRSDTVRRMYLAGHDVGTHTWSHPELTRLTREEIIHEITAAKDKLSAVTGGSSYLVRPPYGSYNDEVKSVGAELGVAFVNWSVDTLDWKTKDASILHDKIISSARDGAVILCHDIHKSTVDAMETAIPQLISEGYQLVTFTEMMAFSNERLQGGDVYRMKQ
ncbi:MAG: polysaccharide deacetylase family protein [Clostridia bacterium]|nr:polysaccharide deacetylase family protein [Clostridia bacterium]